MKLSIEQADKLFKALRRLGYTTTGQTHDVVEVVQALLSDEDLDVVVARIEAENEN